MDTSGISRSNQTRVRKKKSNLDDVDPGDPDRSHKELQVLVATLQAENSELKAESSELKDMLSDLVQRLKDKTEELESLRRIVQADDKLAAAEAELVCLRERDRLAQERIRGLMGEKLEAVRAAKRWKRALDEANGRR